MTVKNLIYFLGLILAGLPNCSYASALEKGRGYYISNNGNDGALGTLQKPWKTIAKLSSIKINPGDSLLLEGGQVFEGPLRLGAAETGSIKMSVYIGAYGKGNSTIYTGEGDGLILYNTAYIEVRNIDLKGAGHNAGATGNGLVVLQSENIFIDSVNITGFRKSGLLIFSSKYVIAQFVNSAENGFAGICIDGEFQEYNSHDIVLRACKAENNIGNGEKQSGHGILAGSCRKVTIEYCVAAGNGRGVAGTATGPVGIRTYESDSMIIQNCIAYRNKASVDSIDGGGYSLDGGVKNSIIRNCLSYSNEGYGYGIFQVDSASYWYNNTIANCISENDGQISMRAGVLIRSNVQESLQFHNFYFQNNTIYNDSVPAIMFEKQSIHANFFFANNILVSKSNLVQNWETASDSSEFICNNWWSLLDTFNIEGQRDFVEWALQYENRMQEMNIAGTNINPAFVVPGKTKTTDPFKLKTSNAYNTLLTKEGLGNLYKPN